MASAASTNPLDFLPSAEPPAGMTSNFVNPSNKAFELLAIDIVFTSLMILSLLLRLLVRLRWTKGWGWHDTCCIIAAFGSLAHMIMDFEATKVGFGRHLWDIPVSWLISIRNNQIMSSAEITYPFATLFAKLSILLLYLRIFHTDRGLRINVYVGGAFLTVFYTALIGTGIAAMTNCVGLASTSIGICDKITNDIQLLNSAFNVVTDCWILVLPMPLISKLQMPLKRKLGVAAVFASGLVAVAASLARLIEFAIHYHSEDVLWYKATESTISVVELNIGIIVSCSLCLPPLVTKTKLFLRSAISTIRQRMRSLLVPRVCPQAPRTDDYEAKAYDELQQNPFSVKTGSFVVPSSTPSAHSV